MFERVMRLSFHRLTADTGPSKPLPTGRFRVPPAQVRDQSKGRAGLSALNNQVSESPLPASRTILRHERLTTSAQSRPGFTVPRPSARLAKFSERLKQLPSPARTGRRRLAGKSLERVPPGPSPAVARLLQFSGTGESRRARRLVG